MLEKEVRNFICEVRAEADEQHGAFITGRPIVLNRETDLGWIRETIDSGALDGTDLKDVRFLVGHDTSMIPLARSRNNNANSTMQLIVDADGLSMRANLDIENNPRAKELYSAVSRGDITGMSFMFTVDKDSWEDIDTDKPKRHITHIRKVFEVSAVAFPAYEATSIEAASDGVALESVKASLESARKQAAEDRARQAEQERRTAALERLRKLTEVSNDEV